MEIDEKILIAMNDEIIQMKKELFFSYNTFLLSFHEKEDVQRSIYYFLAIPSIERKGKSTIEFLIECCEISKTHREDNVN